MASELDPATLTVHLAPAPETPGQATRHIHLLTGAPRNIRLIGVLKQVVNIDGLNVLGVLANNHLFIGAEDAFPWVLWSDDPQPATTPLFTGKLLSAGKKVVTQEYTWRDPSRAGWSYGGNWKTATVTQEDSYIPGHNSYFMSEGRDFDPQDPDRKPLCHCLVELTFPNGQVSQVNMVTTFPKTGRITFTKSPTGCIATNVHVSFGGADDTYVEKFVAVRDVNGNSYLPDDDNPNANLVRHLRHSEIEGGPDALWEAYLSGMHPDDSKTPTEQVASLYKNKAYAPVFARLQAEAPLDWKFFRWLHDTTPMKGKTLNKFLVAMLKEVGANYDKILGALRSARVKAIDCPTKWYDYQPARMDHGLPFKRAVCETLPGVAEKIQAIEAAKDFRKAVGHAAQAEGLGVTAAEYPLLRAAIEKGEIPIGVFHQPGKDGQPVNREFALWERALGQKGWAKVISEISRNASSRSTYERDITPYLMFLFRICKYLDRHAPRGKKGWSAMPKFVQSETELEMDEADENTGTVKKRSALTPVADNDTGIVTVPYVALCVSGVRTQWCYAQHYYIFEEGFSDPETKGVVLRDLEPKLNGRDDYGLCYYTLTGTDIARGYPTFLVIFEKRADRKAPYVHFHRVRPCRSKDGVKTPACRLIEACYQYMAGNIPAKDITAQQGDLIFIKCDNDPIAAKAKVEPEVQTSTVLVFESHALCSLTTTDLTLYRSAAKTPGNRLGFVHAPSGLAVTHPEHDDIKGLVEGWYEIRRCKSWEANPKAVWSLTID